jgi:mono/diheme cytochrome c family protein
MSTRTFLLASAVLALTFLIVGCSPNPQPVGLTPIPTLAPAEPITLVPALQTPPQGGAAQPSGSETAEPAPPSPAAAGDAAKGEQIYTVNCVPCHGQDLKGVVGPSLVTAELKAQPDQFFVDTITNGRAGTAMPAWGDRLSSQDIEDVIAFLRSKQ